MSKFAALRARWRTAPPPLLWLDLHGLHSATDPAAPPAPNLSDWQRQHPGQAPDIVVSSLCLHELLCEPDLPLHDDAALHAYAQQMFVHFFGAGARHWPLASWRQGSRCGASALHSGSAPPAGNGRLRPAWSLGLAYAAHQAPAWAGAPKAGLAWVEGAHLVWLELHHGQLQSLRALRLQAATGAALLELLAELQRPELQVLVLGYGLDQSAHLALGAKPQLRALHDLSQARPDPAWLQAPAGTAWPAPDFWRPIHTPQLGLKAFVASALLALGLAGYQGWHSHTAWQLALNADTAPPPLVRTPARAAPPPRAELEVQALLDHPWEAHLSQLEQAAPPDSGLHWLALDYQATRQELRLKGLAPDHAAALQLAARLSGAAGWHQVQLLRFHKAEPGQSGVGFELSARLGATPQPQNQQNLP